MIEAPSLLQSSIPPDHYAACNAQNIPIVGNAAGNSQDWLDLTGAPAPPGPLPEGFTPRGVVALVCSALSAFVGVAVIAWYVVPMIVLLLLFPFPSYLLLLLLFLLLDRNT